MSKATTGTRLKWSDAAEWLEAWWVLCARHERHISAKTYRDRDAHIAALTVDLVAEEHRPEVLEVLGQVLRAARPAPGRCATWPGTPLIVEAHNRRARLLALRRAMGVAETSN